jgi:hypothetical protein
MKHYAITYDADRRKLTIYHNGKVLGGMIGKIAEQRFQVLKAEIEKVDMVKIPTYGHKAKTPKV